MARGRESKAVAEEMEQAKVEARASAAQLDTSPDARVRRERLESLRLSRARTLEQLERATNPNHREMLERALHALETEMKKLG